MKHGTGNLYWYAMSLKNPWVGHTLLNTSPMWLKGDYQRIEMGWSKDKGLFLKDGMFPTKSRKTKAIKKITAIEKVTFANIKTGKDKFSNINIWKGANKVELLKEENIRWRVSPMARWVVAPGVALPVHARINRRGKKNVRGIQTFIHIDCPVGISPGKSIAFASGNQLACRIDGIKKIDTKAGKYSRYTYKLPAFLTDHAIDIYNTARPFSLALSSTLQPGTSSVTYLSIQWGRNKSKPVEIPVKVIKFPKSVKLKKVVLGMSIWVNQLFAQGDYMKLFRKTGFNMIDCWVGTGLKRKLIGKPLSAVYWRKFTANKFIKTCMVNNITPALTLHHEIFDYLPKHLKAVGINGKPYPNHFSRCPSKNEKMFQPSFKRLQYIASLGASVFIDVEMAGFMKHSPCFCPKCLAGFEKHLRNKFPEVKYLSPQEFEKSPKRYPKLHKLWFDFCGEQASDMLSKCHQAMEAGAKSSKTKPCRQFLSIYDESLWGAFDLHNLAKSKPNRVDLFMGPPLYHNPQANGKNLRTYIKKYPNVKVMPYMGYIYGGLKTDMKSQLFTIFGNGAKGTIVWSIGAMDGQELKEVAEATVALAKVEDIIWDGKVSKDVSVINEEKSNKVHVSLKILEKRGMLFVSDYRKKKTPLKIKFASIRFSKATDLRAGKNLSAKLSNQGKEITINVDKPTLFLLSAN
jgi:hypothetical protein